MSSYNIPAYALAATWPVHEQVWYWLRLIHYMSHGIHTHSQLWGANRGRSWMKNENYCVGLRLYLSVSLISEVSSLKKWVIKYQKWKYSWHLDNGIFFHKKSLEICIYFKIVAELPSENEILSTSIWSSKLKSVV